MVYFSIFDALNSLQFFDAMNGHGHNFEKAENKVRNQLLSIWIDYYM